MRSRIFGVVLILVFLAVAVVAQVQIEGWHLYPELKKCPETVAEYSRLQVAVALPKVWTKEQIAQIKFDWNVSQGRINDGQGTEQITIDTGPGDITLTVEVSLKGPMFPNVKESCTVSVLRPEPKLFQEFEFSNEEHFQMLSDLFFLELSNNPASSGGVILYAQTDQGLRRLQNLMKRWSDFRKTDTTRFKIVKVAKSRIRGVQFWMIPPGADDPKPALLDLKDNKPQK